MKIYRFKNGDRCPCCGQVIWNKTPEELAEFSLTVYVIGYRLGWADWILHPGDDAIDVSIRDILTAAFSLLDKMEESTS